MTIASLVVDIAAQTASLQRSVDQANAKLESVVGIAGKVGAALAGAFAVTKIIGMGEQVIDFAGKLTDLSAKTGISTTGLQKLGAAVEQSGVSLDAVSNATTKLALNLIEGDKSAVGALGQLGLSVSELKTMAPEQQFLKVADAIGGIQNPTEKAWAAMQVFGKGGAELLSALDGNMEAAASQAEKLGLIIDEKTVAAADNFGDQLGLLGKQLMGIVATVVGPLLPALSALGNVLAWVGRDILQPVLGASIKVVMTLLAGFWEQLTGVLGGLAELGSKIPGVGGKFAEMSTWLKNSSKASGDYLAQLWDNTAKVEQSAVKAAPALLGLGDASEKVGEKAGKAAPKLEALESVMRRIASVQNSTANGLYSRGPAFDDVDAYLARLTAVSDQMRTIEQGAVGSTLSVGVQLDIESAKSALDTLNIMASKTFGGILSSAVADLPQLLQRAFTGGGGAMGAMKAFASKIGGGLGEGLFNAGGALNGLGNKLTGIFGSAFGLALPGIGNALGALAGPLFGKLTGKIAGIFSSTEKQVNPVRQAFVDAAGGLATLNERAAGAGVTLQALLDAKNPKQYEAAVRDLNKAFEAHDKVLSDIDSGVSGVVASYRSAGGSIPDALKNSIQSLTTMKGLTDAQKSALSGLVADARPNFEALEQTAAGYGITLAGLGPQFAQGRLEDSAAKIFSDFTALKSAGADVGGVLLGMSDKIGKLVQDSVQFGTAIPDNMQPLIQNLIDAGKLTDASGKAIKDIGGIKFEESPVSKGFDTLAQSIDRLVSTLTNTLPRALDNLPDETDLNVNINYNENGRPSGLADPLRDVDVTPMADGGMGRVTRPTLFLAGEAGAEDFAFSGGGRSFRSGGGSASLDTSGLSAKLDQVNEQQTRLNDYMTGTFARDLARATRDEVQKVAWRKRY